MKNRANKLLSAFLALITLLAVIPFSPMTAFAAETTYPTEPLTLTSHGIGADATVKFKGDDGKQYAIQDYLTRVNGQNGTVGYCISPFKGGVYPAGSTTVKVKDPTTNTALDKQILGIMMAGYPAKPASEFGLTDAEAWYATESAIKNFLFQHTDAYPNSKGCVFSDNDWSKHWYGNDKVIAAAKKIYDAGIANPYDGGTTGDITITPVGGDNKMTANVTNPDTGAGTLEITFEITADPPFSKGKIMFDDPMIKQIVNSTKPTSKILVNGTEQNFKTGIMGGKDYDEGIAVTYTAPKTTVKIVLDKLTAESYVPNPDEYINAGFKLETEGGGTFAAYMTENTASGYKQDYVVLLPEAVTERAAFALTRAEDGGGDPGDGWLKILKYNKKTHQLTPGAIFHVLGLDDSNYFINVQILATAGAAIPLPNGGQATVQNGVITLTGIPTGNYQITEISPPPNFDYCDFGINSQVVYVPADGMPGVFPQVEFENNPYGGMELLKIDSVTGQPVNGVILRVRNPQTGFDQEFTTMNGGKININNLPQGNYEVSEVYAPNNYVKSNEKKMVSVVWGETTKVTFENEPKTAIALLKIDTVTGERLEGAIFELTDPQTGAKWTLETFSDGVAYAEDIPAGTYNLTEIHAPEGYILDSAVLTVVLKNNMTNEITLMNSKTPTLIVDKYDEKTGERLGGAEFRLSHKGGVMVEEFMMDDSGQKAFPNLPVGWYTIEEIAAPWGYIAATESKDIYLSPNSVVHVKFDNRLRPALEILKIDEETKKPLAGAKFKVWKAEDSTVSEYVTGADGRIIINNLNEAVYSIEEIIAPSGYLLEVQHKDIQLEWGVTKTLIFTNKARPKLRILKVDAVTGQPLPFAEFRVTKVEDATVSEYITDASGEILIENLDEAIYRAEEFMPPDGYLLYDESKEILTEWGKTKTLKFDDIRKPTLIITKTNGLTFQPIANATFRVEREGENGGLVQIGTFRTDANGQIILPKVEPGWYLITETIPAPGFSLPSNPVTRKYLAPGENAYTNTSGTGAAGDTSGMNIRALSGSDFSALAGHEVIDYPLNSLVIRKAHYVTGELLAGAVFEVRKVTEDVSGNSGTVIGRYTTDNSGVLVITGLQPGGYVIEEIKAPPNFLISENSTQQAWLKLDGTSIVEVTFANIPYGSLLITKVDAQTNKPLANARFRVVDGSGAVAGNTNGEFVTDENGEILIPNLKPGAYVITEIEAPQYYTVDTTPQTVQIGVDGKTYKVSFKDQPAGEIVIRKLDYVTHEPLAGAEFKVTASDGSVVGTGNGVFKTDATGTIKIPNLPKGSYVLEEIKAPTDYILEDQTQTVAVDYGKTYTIDFYNKHKSGLQIIKIDSQTKQPLKHAEFTVYKQNGEIVGRYETDADGVIIIDTLNPGWYKLVETKAPDGFILDETPKDVEITDNQFIKVVFENNPLSGLLIRKVDADTLIPLEGAEFQVRTVAGLLIGNYRTGGDGTVQLPTIAPGWYSVTETKAPDGYSLGVSNVQTVEITHTKLVTIEFRNHAFGSIVIKKIDEISGAPLAGANFTVKRQNGLLVGEYTTGTDGTITVSNVESGWYVVSEDKAPTGYTLDNTAKTVEVKPSAPTVVTFTNKPLSGIEILKTDAASHAPLSGATFTVERANGERIGTYKTDAAGKIIVPGLAEGVYVVSETIAPDGYILSEQPKNVTVVSGKLVTVEFQNNKKGGLQIIKQDATTGEPLPGAKFTVYKKSGDVIGEYTTDANGVIIIDNLASGWVKIAETKAPSGYLISEAPKDVEVTHGQFIRVVFTNERLASLQIKKVDETSGVPLAGAVFTVEKQNGEKINTRENGVEWVTDAQGLINIPTLAPGFYIVREIKAPVNYIIDSTPKTVEVKTDAPTVVVVNNKPLAGLKIVKLNAETRNPIEGVEFTIDRMNGEHIDNDFRQYTFKTDKAGQIYVPNLADGYYLVTETKAADGYFIESEPKTVLVQSGKTTLLEVLNKPMSGLLIVKTDANTGKPLQGVVFDVRRADGQLVYGTILDGNQPNTGANSPNRTTSPNGDITGSYTTDAQGRILINSLPAGEYHITERKQLDGYELDTEVHAVTVTPGKLATLQLKNTPKAGLRLIKIDSITKKPIYNVEFMVFDANNKVVGTYYTDNNGVIDFSAILTQGRYTIRETRAAAGYYRDDLPRTVEFVAGQVTEIRWENVPEMGQVQIIKKSGDDNEINGLPAGSPLAGATFEIYEYKSGNLVDRFVSGSDGRAVSKPLPLGRYTIKEVAAPQWYKVSDKTLDITIEFATQILKMEVLNYSANTGVYIKKTGPAECMPGDTIKYDIREVRNTGTVPLTDFYWRDSLPVDAARVTKLVTGTYNQSLKYKVIAVTNKGETKVVADNLSTTRNNVIDFSNASLGLRNDEYIVSFTLIFGTVKAGFCQVEAPQVYVKVLAGLPNGYQFANKADCGGKYGREWVLSNSTTVCTVYNPTLPGKLPRTGY
jgi:uncharacterized repeat protein (TIGR01451 family)